MNAIRVRLSIAITALFFAAACQSTVNQKTEPAPFFALSVENIELMSDWYSDTFGLDTALEATRPPPDGPVVLLVGTSAIVELQQRTDARDLHDRDGLRRNAHTVLGVFKVGLRVEDIDRTLAKLESQNVPLLHGIVQLPDSVGYRTFAVHDPEGNVVQFFGE